jgi:glutamate/tyrosine decarboxylase-like PLP-dependent enzyme
MREFLSSFDEVLVGAITERRFRRRTSDADVPPGDWFLGPEGGNGDVLTDVLRRVVDATVDGRRASAELRPADHGAHRASVVGDLGDDVAWLAGLLASSGQRSSTMQYQGHMVWDTSLPAIGGYVAGLLDNSNNISYGGSPVTTVVEAVVVADLCRMLGFRLGVAAEPWGHLASSGTVSNIEAAWAAREIRFAPLALGALARRQLPAALSCPVVLPSGDVRPLARLSGWELVNLRPAAALDLLDRVAELTGLGAEGLAGELAAFLPNGRGLGELLQLEEAAGVEMPAIVVAGTAHYSWTKAAALLGLGADLSLVTVPVDGEARLSLPDLRGALDDLAAQRRPVLAVVATIGTTAESAVDPLDGILALRESRAADGTTFWVHADAAWGGYGITALRRDYASLDDAEPFDLAAGGGGQGAHTARQLGLMHQADSVTVDPHKLGYAPYPAASIVFRDGRVRRLLRIGAPYLDAEAARSMGVGTLDGSRPGAAATAVLAGHAAIGPSMSGFGRLITRTVVAAKLFFCLLVLTPEWPRAVRFCPVTGLRGRDDDELAAAATEVVKYLSYHGIETSLRNLEFLELVGGIGPDQNVVTFAATPVGAVAGRRAHDLDLLNQRVLEELRSDPAGLRIGLSQSEITRRSYGDDFIDGFAARLGLEDAPAGIVVVRSVVMNPLLATDQGLPVLYEAVRRLDEAAHRAVAPS